MICAKMNHVRCVRTSFRMYSIYVMVWVVGHFIVGQVLRRQPWASRHKFNEDILNVNSLLKDKMDNLDGAYFWPHRGFWAELSYLGRDGVHIERDSRHMKNICTVLEVLFCSIQDKYVCVI